MSEHSPTPWLHDIESIWAGSQHVARLDGSHDLASANGDFIVRAVNLHGEMVEALEDLIRAMPAELSPLDKQALRRAEEVLAKATTTEG